jgi:hypothetical protein
MTPTSLFPLVPLGAGHVRGAYPEGNFMEERRVEARIDVCWYLRAGHRTAGINCARTLNASTSGLLFLSELPYDVGDHLEMEIFMGPVTAIRCVVRIVREEPAASPNKAYGAVFVKLSEPHRQILAAALLAARRSQLADQYAPSPWANRNKAGTTQKP